MADIEEIRKKIDRLITEGGLNYRDVSLKIGRKDSYIQQYVKYGYPRRLKEIDRMRLAGLLNVDDSELMDDEIIATKANTAADGSHHIISDLISSSRLPDANLEVLEVVSPQPKTCGQTLQVIGKNFIGQNILNDFGINQASHIKMVKITSDAMKPSINTGDYVWFDSSYKIPDGNGLYLFSSGCEFSVRRVELSPLDGSVDIRCDNKIYKDYRVAKREDIKTCGKIIALIQKI